VRRASHIRQTRARCWMEGAPWQRGAHNAHPLLRGHLSPRARSSRLKKEASRPSYARRITATACCAQRISYSADENALRDGGAARRWAPATRIVLWEVQPPRSAATATTRARTAPLRRRAFMAGRAYTRRACRVHVAHGVRRARRRGRAMSPARARAPCTERHPGQARADGACPVRAPSIASKGRQEHGGPSAFALRHAGSLPHGT
jgi:hypothetical protein